MQTAFVLMLLVAGAAAGSSSGSGSGSGAAGGDACALTSLSFSKPIAELASGSGSGSGSKALLRRRLLSQGSLEAFGSSSASGKGSAGSESGSEASDCSPPDITDLKIKVNRRGGFGVAPRQRASRTHTLRGSFVDDDVSQLALLGVQLRVSHGRANPLPRVLGSPGVGLQRRPCESTSTALVTGLLAFGCLRGSASGAAPRRPIGCLGFTRSCASIASIASIAPSLASPAPPRCASVVGQPRLLPTGCWPSVCLQCLVLLVLHTNVCAGLRSFLALLSR